MVDLTSGLSGIIPSKASLTSSFGTLFIWITIFILVMLILIGGGIAV